jgi:hypothetical protein
MGWLPPDRHGPALDDLARKATVQAVRLDDQAPKREVARLKKEQDDGRAAAEKCDSRTRGLSAMKAKQ